MCMQSVSLWAEATWYRLGGGHVAVDEVSGDVPAEASVPPASIERVEVADEKVLVSR